MIATERRTVSIGRLIEGQLPARLPRAVRDEEVARRVERAASRMRGHRKESIATLNAIFKEGKAPEPKLDGRFSGSLITSTVAAPLDTFGRFMAGLWMPWKGKRFNQRAGGGDNVFSAGMQILGRLYWPLYSAYRPYRAGLLTAFRFDTFVAPGVGDPEIDVLKLDYDRPGNPRFLVRQVLDELVQVSDNYYLGKAYIWRGKKGFRLAAFFALREEP